jgi:hypothetical protein
MTDRITTGGDIASYCTKCRLNLEHIVVAMVGAAVVEVKCKTCGSMHRVKETPAAKPGTSRKKSVASRPVAQTSVVWEIAIGAARGPELAYDMARSCRAGDVILHPIFGKGVVQKTFFKKCSVLFKDRERVLATSNT